MHRLATPFLESTPPQRYDRCTSDDLLLLLFIPSLLKLGDRLLGNARGYSTTL